MSNISLDTGLQEALIYRGNEEESKDNKLSSNYSYCLPTFQPNPDIRISFASVLTATACAITSIWTMQMLRFDIRKFGKLETNPSDCEQAKRIQSIRFLILQKIVAKATFVTSIGLLALTTLFKDSELKSPRLLKVSLWLGVGSGIVIGLQNKFFNPRIQELNS